MTNIQTARASGLEKFPIPYVLTNCHNSLCAVGGTINEDDHMFGLTCGSSDREVFNYMFRLWGKMWKDNHMLKDIVIDDDSEDTRTHKIFRALQEICYDFDLENPIWLDSNVADFKRHARTRFRQDSFIEHIEFDYLEIQVIEED